MLTGWANRPERGPAMPNVLTSWKEIGQYLGKGVRTVQRWERESGLPVRRPTDPCRRAVLAIPEELDAWRRSRTSSHLDTEFASVHGELAELREETADLRSRVACLETHAAPASPRRKGIRMV
jgi:hypothetical protein